MPFFQFLFVYPIFEIIFAPALGHGTLAQLVEQRTENPCVPGSIPGGTTKKPANIVCGFFVFGKNGIEVYAEQNSVFCRSNALEEPQDTSLPE